MMLGNTSLMVSSFPPHHRSIASAQLVWHNHFWDHPTSQTEGTDPASFFSCGQWGRIVQVR